jgi:hypothetical protein
MDAYSRLREVIKATIARDCPQEFWREARERAKVAYRDEFHEVANNPNVVKEQRLDRLHQQRHFRMERELMALAEKFGLDHSTTWLECNGRCYVYVASGAIGLTQAYVPYMGAMPNPRRYRERLASRNEIPRLDLGDEPEGVILAKEFYGVLAHNPMDGKVFGEEGQRLAMLQLCVPTGDGKAWGAELAIEEILSAYPETRPLEAKPERKPVWKKQNRRGSAE